MIQTKFNETRFTTSDTAQAMGMFLADRLTEPPCAELAVVVARNALRYADALIAEAEKGGANA